jgi:hypothetical protein
VKSYLPSSNKKEDMMVKRKMNDFLKVDEK